MKSPFGFTLISKPSTLPSSTISKSLTPLRFSIIFFSSLSEIMDIRHQSSAMCIIMLGGGGRRHTPVVCNESTEPHTSHNPSRNNFFKKLQQYTGFKKTICNKFFQTHLCRPQFLEHRPHCRSEEPLKSVASKSCQLVDRRANDRAFYRDA